MRSLNDGLGEVFGAPPVRLPTSDEVNRLSALKRYEDVLDAIVCGWVSVCFVEGAAEAYGDESAAIWVPMDQSWRRRAFASK